MQTWHWIVVASLIMSAVAMVGSITILLPRRWFKKLLTPLVSLAAGTLIGGALFHLFPESIDVLGNKLATYLVLSFGFLTFFILEQFLHWHHRHNAELQHRPVGYLILLADGLHNFIGGLAIGSAFVINIKLGIITWLVELAHEIPQELGDFAILVKSGWKRRNALLVNVLSALTFPLGAILVYLLPFQDSVAWLLPFAAGNFLYIGAADLIPQLKSDHVLMQIVQLLLFLFGLLIMFILA